MYRICKLIINYLFFKNMEEHKLKLNGDENEYFIVEFLKNISVFKKLVISTLIPAYLTYRFLAKRYLYSEHHGHFNSPNRILNRKLTEFHLQDAFVRFGFGFLILYGALTFIKIKLRG